MEYEMISVRKLDYYVNNPYAEIVDLRSGCEDKRKHIKNAINICSDDIDSKMDMLNRSKIIVLYCERGSLSLIAAKKLSNRGYLVKSVIGGLNMYNGKNLITGS